MEGTGQHDFLTLSIKYTLIFYTESNMVRVEHIEPTQMENEEEAPPLAPPAYPPPAGVLFMEPVEPDVEPDAPKDIYG